MNLVERDNIIVREIARWRCLLGRQIQIIAGFTGQRATDRRLKKLMENGFIERKRIVYGVAGLYFVTQKGHDNFGLKTSSRKERIDQIHHDIAVADTGIYIVKSIGLSFADLKTEKELRSSLGFNSRTHVPDIVYEKDGKNYCVEIELSLKSNIRLEKNISNNYTKYDKQYWIVPRNKGIIKERILQVSKKYTDIEILDLEDIEQNVKKQ